MTATTTAVLRPMLSTGALRVRLSGAFAGTQQVEVPGIADTPSDFSSRGVRGPAVKPDVAGPWGVVTSVQFGSGDGRLTESGTSMASPFVAGVAALVREEHRDWTPAQVKAAIMDTTADVHAGEAHTGPVLAPTRVGSGRVDAMAALATPCSLRRLPRPGR
jgi:subtilisin family serine protease